MNFVHKFFEIISRIESITQYPIKAIAFDFDCTLSAIHTTGCYNIYDLYGKIDNTKVKDLFPHPQFIQKLIPTLVNKGIEIGIISHSDPRFAEGKPNVVGGPALIIPIMNYLLSGNFFNTSNVVAFSNPVTLSNPDNLHKKTHIDIFLQNINMQKFPKTLNKENILLIDDSRNNIINRNGFQALLSNYFDTNLSLSTDIRLTQVYLESLNKQIDQQLRLNYGFQIKPSTIIIPFLSLKDSQDIVKVF